MEHGFPYPLIDALHQHDVPVLLIGGHAVAYHGYIRGTEDVDVLFLRNAEAEQSLLTALRAINACQIGDEIDPQTGIERLVPVSESYVVSTQLMMLVTDFGYLDVFDFVPGFPDIPVKRLFETAEDLDGRKVVSLDWLRRMKEASGRPSDLLDLKNLSDEN